MQKILHCLLPHKLSAENFLLNRRPKKLKMSFTLKEGGLTVTDYVVFGVLVFFSCAGGLWYSATASRKKSVVNVKDYLLGGKAMNTFPVALSLIATYVSGVTVLGTPAEVYNYGTQYWMIVVGIICSTVLVGVIYMPVFCKLRLSSSYEYLELRFNRHVRAVASILFLLDEILFLPMVVYVPALAFNQMTKANVFIVGGVMVLTCGLYTVLGGLRAVVWTDSVQIAVMFLSVSVVTIAGTIAAGGFYHIFSVANETGRLSLSNWSFSPYERQTGWGAIIGGTIYWTCFNGVNQTMVQRYISLANKKKARRAITIFASGISFAISLCVWGGILAYVVWVNDGCHPGGKPLVDDRVFPAFVTHTAATLKIPGLAGVFLAGVFGAALSSLSAVLNACALVVVEDIFHGWLRLYFRPMVEGLLARSVSAVLAILSIVMVLVIEKLGGVLGAATALSAIAASATCGIFSLGMFCWWVGPRGAMVGGLAGAIVAGTLSMGTQAAAAKGFRAVPLNLTETCAKNASYVFTSLNPEKIAPAFRISYHWIAPAGFFVTIIVGALAGCFLDKKSGILQDGELYTPIVHRFLPPEFKENRGTAKRLRTVRESRLIIQQPAVAEPLILTRIDKGSTDVDGTT